MAPEPPGCWGAARSFAAARAADPSRDPDEADSLAAACGEGESLTDSKRPHAERRLRDEKIAWLTTVRRDGQPQSSPVWFLWRDGEVVLYSKPTTQKVRNVQANPRVAVHLRDVNEGSDIVSIEGDATIDARYPQAAAIPAYVKKYSAMIADLGMDPTGFASSYSVPIRIRPTRMRID
jgi:PPOX class probable F420-dependent enzyme